MRRSFWGISANSEIALRLHGRDPSGCGVAEISDMHGRRGVLPLHLDVHADLGKSASETIRQSDAAKLIRGGENLRLGGKK